MKTKISLLALLIPVLGYTQFYPPPACVSYDSATLTICPPDSVPAYTGGLLGYNIYVNDAYHTFVASSGPTDTAYYSFDPLPEPGTNSFCAKAIYQNWISDAICDTAFLYYGYPPPFFEGWDSQSFDTNQWVVEEDGWTIATDEGDPAPAASFPGQAGQANYSKSLISYPILADTILHGTLWLEFDLMLNSQNPSGNEELYVQLWDWTVQDWYNVIQPYSNAAGSFGWTHKKINISYYAREKVFKARFMAQGSNSSDIIGWFVDNISIQRTCLAPQNLQVAINPGGFLEVYWESPTGCGYTYPFPLNWCDGVNYTHIGTGGAAEFDVAARWSPAMLSDLEGESIFTVAFVPGESMCTYAIRIWEGDAANLVYEQPVQDPEIDEWNTILLDSAHAIDITQMLWIGYHVNTTTGYPAGCDDGPAADDWGNMMFWEDQWSTLLEINPELDYNWSIHANLAEPNPMYCANRLYRSTNDSDFVMIAELPMGHYYKDEEADPAESNCYMVTDVMGKFGDTCESAYSNMDCYIPIGIGEPENKDGILFYPNPASDRVTVESASIIFSIEIMDLTGRKVLERWISSDKTVIPLNNFSPGIYLLKVQTENGWATRKICVRND